MLSAEEREVDRSCLEDLESEIELTYRENGWKTSNTTFRRRYAIHSLEVDWQIVIACKSSRVDTSAIRNGGFWTLL